MRHAHKAATISVIWVSMAALSTTDALPALAIDSPGGTAAPGAGTVVQPSQTGGASSAEAATKGTGGAVFGIAPPRKETLRKPRSSAKSPGKPPTRGVRRKVAKPAPKVKPKPSAKEPSSPGTTLEAGTPTPAQTAAEGAVFPVRGPHSFGGAENRFGAGRAGYKHQGQDVLASEGLPVLAPLAGTIITTGYQAGGAGWYVAEHTLDGLDFFYAHCQAGSLAVSAAGQPVSAGEQLCRVGQTGDATGPHLHFEVWVGGWRTSAGKPVDPLPYLEAWEGG